MVGFGAYDTYENGKDTQPETNLPILLAAKWANRKRKARPSYWAGLVSSINLHFVFYQT